MIRLPGSAWRQPCTPCVEVRLRCLRPFGNTNLGMLLELHALRGFAEWLHARRPR